jgi:hypothetical protein
VGRVGAYNSGTTIINNKTSIYKQINFMSSTPFKIKMF